MLLIKPYLVCVTDLHHSFVYLWIIMKLDIIVVWIKQMNALMDMVDFWWIEMTLTGFMIILLF